MIIIVKKNLGDFAFLFLSFRFISSNLIVINSRKEVLARERLVAKFRRYA
jgi:hypothetical protein